MNGRGGWGGESGDGRDRRNGKIGWESKGKHGDGRGWGGDLRGG